MRKYRIRISLERPVFLKANEDCIAVTIVFLKNETETKTYGKISPTVLPQCTVNNRTEEQLPLVALCPPPVTLSQSMLGNDAVVMKVLEVG